MNEILSQWLTKEILKHPAVLFFGLVLGSGGAGFLLNPFVLAEDYQQFQQATKEEMKELKQKMNQVDNSLCRLDYTSNINATEQKIIAAEQEVFALERLESSGEAEERDLKRLDEQRSTLRRLTDELRELRRNHCR